MSRRSSFALRGGWHLEGKGREGRKVRGGKGMMRDRPTMSQREEWEENMHERDGGSGTVRVDKTRIEESEPS